MKGSKTMNEKARQARAKYLREWRKRNPEKVKKSMNKYWSKVAKQIEEKEKEDGNKDAETS